MFKILNRNREVVGLITSPINPVIDDTLTGMNELRFSVPASQEGLELEGYIRIENEHEYVIKEISTHGHNREVIAIMNVEELIGKVWTTFRSVDTLPSECIREIVVGTGWTVIDNCPPNKRRNLYGTKTSSWDLIFLACDVFNIEVKFDTFNKTITTLEKGGTDRGTYFMSDLNLKQLMHDSHTHKLITRVIPIGKDGLTIEEVNNGKNYIENHSYSNKIITGIWQSDRYTNAQDLKDDATLYLEEMCVPYESYECKVSDLYRLENNPNFEFNVGDVIYLIDNITKKKIQQRIVKHTKNLTAPDKDTINLANKSMSFTDYYKRLQLIANMTEQAIGTDGLISNGSIESIESSKITGDIKATLLESDIIISEHIKSDQILAGHIKANQIYGEHIVANEIDTKHIKANSINAGHIQSNSIVSGHIQSNSIVSGHIQSGSVESGHIKSGSIETSHIKSNSIDTIHLKANLIEGSHIKGNVIESSHIATNSITSNHLQTNSIKSEHLSANTITSNHIQTGAITAGSGIIANGAIGSAQISSLDANKINAGEIDTSKVKIKGENGFLFIENNTLYVVDNNKKIRCELGVIENNSNYGFVVRGADGQTIMLDHRGVHNAGITDGAIDNRKVSENANISGKKLDIDSVVKSINEDGSVTLQGTKVQIGNTTLDVKLSEHTNLITEQGEKLNTQQAEITANTNAIKLKVDTQTYTADKNEINTKLNKATSDISVMQGKIDLKVEQTDIENAIDELSGSVDEKISDAKAEIKVTTDTISQNVSKLTTTVSNKADGSTVSTLSNKVGSLETSVNGISGKVSSLETSTATMTQNITKAQQDATKGINDAKTASDKATSAQNTANTANSTANTNKNNIGTLQTEVSTVKSNVAILDVNLQGITQRVASTESTLTTTNSKIDNLQVGANNLWVLSDLASGYESSGSITSASIVHKTRKTLVDISDCKSIVYQVWNPNKVANTSNTNRVAFFNEDKVHVASIQIPKLDGTTYQTATITVPSNAVYVRLGAITGNGSTEDSELKIKFEKGNKPTDWLPSREDVENDATTKANNALNDAKAYTTTEVQKTNNKVAEIITNVDSITQRVSSTESTTSTLSTKVTTIEGTANTANSNATNALNKANTATTTANSASTNATNALNKANSAIETAGNAKDTADTAIETAEGANTTAGNALSTANKASEKVTSVEKEVTSTKAKVASIETNLDSISQRVASNETTTSTLTTTVETVKTTANNANTNASNALDKANTASTNASNAVTTANKANTTANTASTNATTALNTANTAKDTADSASTKADGAVSTANTAKSTADKAQTTANTANNTANTNKNNITTLQATVTTTNDKVAELTTSLDGITQRVSSTETNTANLTQSVDKLKGGLNKWLFEIFDRGTVSGTVAITSSDLIGKTPRKTLLIDEMRGTTQAYGESFLGRLTTHVYLDSDYTLSTNATSDDGGTLYLNGKVIATTNTVAKSVTLPFTAGWNKITWVFNENTGGEGAWFSTALYSVSQIKIINAFNQTNIDEEKLVLNSNISSTNNRVAEIVTNLDSITQRVSSTESTVSTHTTQLGTVDSRINTAKNSAISTASSDATTKANNALASAKTDATTKANNALADAKTYTNGQITTVNQTINNKVAEIKTTTDAITQRVSSTENTTSSLSQTINKVSNGLNKWLLEVFDRGSVTGNGYITANDLVGKLPKQTLLLAEPLTNANILNTDQFLARISTNVYFDADYSWTTTAYSDDGSSIYLNGNLIVSLTSCASTNVTLPFKKGWNKIVWTFNENAGADCAYFTPALSSLSQAKIINAFNQTNIDEEKVALNSKISTTNDKVASIETNLNSITSRVSSAETTLTQTKNKVDTATTNISNLTSRVSTAESKLTKDSLTTTIGNHYTTSTDVNGIVTSKGYATTSQVQQTADNVQFRFEESGGYNRLRNSAFKDGTNHWHSLNWNHGGSYNFEVYQAGVSQWCPLNRNALVAYAGNTTNTGDYIGVGFDSHLIWGGVHWTFSCLLASHRTQEILVEIIEYDSAGNRFPDFNNWRIEGNKSGGHYRNDWHKFERQFTLRNSGCANFVVRIFMGRWNGESNNAFLFMAEPLLVLGHKSGLPYTPNADEVYAGITSIDQDGIKVQHESGSYSRMNSQEFFQAREDGTRTMSLRMGAIRTYQFPDDGAYNYGYLGGLSSSRSNASDKVYGQTIFGTSGSGYLSLGFSENWEDNQNHPMSSWLMLTHYDGNCNVNQGIHAYKPFYMRDRSHYLARPYFYAGIAMPYWQRDDLNGEISYITTSGSASAGTRYIQQWGADGILLGVQNGGNFIGHRILEEYSTGAKLYHEAWGNWDFKGWSLNNARVTYSLSNPNADLASRDRRFTREATHTLVTTKLVQDRGEDFTMDGCCIVEIPDDIKYNIGRYDVNIIKYGRGDIWVSERTPDYFVVESDNDIKFTWVLEGELLENTMRSVGSYEFEFEEATEETCGNLLEGSEVTCASKYALMEDEQMERMLARELYEVNTLEE